jgi:hypothetical protein
MGKKHTCRRAHRAFYIRRPSAVITIVSELPNPNSSWLRFCLWSGVPCTGLLLLSNYGVLASPRIGRTRILLRVMDSWCVDEEPGFHVRSRRSLRRLSSLQFWGSLESDWGNYPHALILPHLSAGVFAGSSVQWVGNCRGPTAVCKGASRPRHGKVALFWKLRGTWPSAMTPCIRPLCLCLCPLPLIVALSCRSNCGLRL